MKRSYRFLQGSISIMKFVKIVCNIFVIGSNTIVIIHAVDNSWLGKFRLGSYG